MPGFLRGLFIFLKAKITEIAKIKRELVSNLFLLIITGLIVDGSGGVRVFNDIQIIVNTPLGKISRSDEYKIGRVAMAHDVPCLTTLSAAWAAVQAIRTLQAGPLNVCAIQDIEKM